MIWPEFYNIYLARPKDAALHKRNTEMMIMCRHNKLNEAEVFDEPSHRDEHQVTKDIGAMVDLNVIHFINEPTPTTVAYGLDKKAASICEKKNGRLQPFKKGFVHLALQSDLPIVPMILTSTHLAWKKGSLHVRPTPLTVKYLPPISTESWKPELSRKNVKMVLL
ncbi:hypothetical protein Fmac_010307 [Flemingia macrophylla]|uniref:Uncharacterized protein n=1 Tax=Flemingia macrophylla TaxID=520843 RepID=A0ABD1MJ77_9FABA